MKYNKQEKRTEGKKRREKKRREAMKGQCLSTYDDRRPDFYNVSEEDRKRNRGIRSSGNERSLPGYETVSTTLRKKTVSATAA